MESSLKRSVAAIIAILILLTAFPFGSTVFATSDESVNYNLERDVSNYYGIQLSGLEREVYDSLVSQFVTKGNTASYTHTLETPITFKAEVKNLAIVENEDLKAVKEKISRAFQCATDAFLSDYPEVFWLYNVKHSYNISASYTSNGWIAKVSSISILPVEIYNGAASKVDEFNTAVDNTIAKILATVSNKNDMGAVLKAAHDYICKEAYYSPYDYNAVHTAEPIFLGSGAVVCEGYAKSFKIICDELGIPCVLVHGVADTGNVKNEAHMWNYVQMENGKWYLVDATWDDQIKDTKKTYFLSGWDEDGFYEKVRDERIEETDFSNTGYMNFVYPTLNNKGYYTYVHNWDTGYTVDVKPTCTTAGSRSRHCLNEGCTDKIDITPIPAKGHDYEDIITKATLTKDGSKYEKCSVCGKKSDSEKIKKISSVKLSYTTYTYNGKTKTPSVVVKDSAGKTISSKYYTVKYASGRKNVGKYKVTVTFKGKYSGTKTLYFKINPAKTTVSKLAAGKKSIKVYITKKTSQVTGYQIQYSTSKSFKSAKIKYITSYKTTSTTLKSLYARKVYYVRVRTYKTVNGVKYYSGWSTYKYTKTK